MEPTRAPSVTRLMLLVAAGSFAALLLVCSLYGWYVGGRPPGWFEGKHLVIPMYAWGALCAFPAVIVALGGTVDLVRSGLDGVRALRGVDWASLAGVLALCLLLVSHFWYPWGLAVVYWVSHWRQGLWMPDRAENPIFVL